ncbi:response regulator [Aestuariispira insulae]|uniref:CheY-like chemotaxis protein n=1 Tax=Aestuariispira insulae TaxID=1461337 RepID=A0A3D9HJM4_9PROT|nr:response regulator [Aestuariispira insulae]RED49654.1 CheY-like chemotaxis protein [Aestuariispira insulae]
MTSSGVLEKCAILHCEPFPLFAEELDGLLRENGVKHLVHLSGIEQLLSRKPGHEFDILLIDFDQETDRAATLVRDVRRGKTGLDPFIPVLATQARGDYDVICREMSAGVDCVLLKPFNLQELITHLEGIIYNQRRFVISADYVGPDRRLKKRQEEENILFQVPNRLKLMQLGKLKPGRINEWHDEWCRKLQQPS